MKRILALATVVAFLAIWPHQAIAKDTWVSVQSKNFFLVGNASEKEIKQVAARLEQFRDVFTRLFPKIKFSTPVPATVIVFKSEGSFKPFRPDPNTAGFFQPGQDINYIALTMEDRGVQDPFSVIFHEYVHLLVNNTTRNMPVWFNEGLAEYYSTFKVSDDQKVALGTAIGYHVLLLREKKLLPLRTLFQVNHDSPHYNERDKASIFYAQSWALVHYLMIGKPGMAEKVGPFLDKLMAEVPVEQAFQQSFEVTFEAMEKELRDYVRQDRYNVLNGHFQRKLETDTDLKVAPVSEAEAQAYLGDLLLHSNRVDSKTYLEKALSLDPNSVLANTAMGMAKLRDGDPAKALVHLERAVTANNNNFLAHYYYAYALSGQGSSQKISSYPPEVAARMRQELLKAIELRPDYPESYSLLAFVSLVTGANVVESIKLVTGVLKTSPGRADLLLMLGQLYVRSGDYRRGTQLLEQVTKSSAEDGVKKSAQDILDQIGPFLTQLEQSASSPGPNGPSLIVSSSNLHDLLRKPAADETQVQGTLLAIECDNNGVTFVVKTGSQMLRLHTTNFESIDLRSYNSAVKGDIGCGGRPDDPVVVCYKAESNAKLKSDGVLKSVEFVPPGFKLR